jgi:hypothetical protein
MSGDGERQQKDKRVQQAEGSGGWLFIVLMWVGVQREGERVCEKSQEEM